MNTSQPLGLPEGSVRALIALTVVIGTVTLLGLDKPIPEWLQGGFFTLIGFYFGARTGAKVGASESTVVAKSRVGSSIQPN